MTLFARAPLRIDFAGGWTDVPVFAEAENGAVVNAAIARYANVEAILGDKRIRLHALDRDQRITLPSSRAIRYDGSLDAHKAALNMLPVTGGIEVFTNSDAPAGAGLGASAALAVAMLAVLARGRSEQYEAEELAEFGFMLEAGELRMLSGRQDQCAAAGGGFQSLRFDRDGVQAHRVVLDADGVRALEDHMLLLYTGTSHVSRATHERVWAAYEREDLEVTDALRCMRALVPEAESALTAGDWRTLATVIDENWRQQQRLDGTIATERTRVIEGAVRDAGAWGLKATGAGGGGCLVVLVPPDKRDAVARAAERTDAIELPFHFAERGVEVWESADAGVES
jgi:D-glycero-alpha-D-manno-heptose-7-phosphate kinase